MVFKGRAGGRYLPNRGSTPILAFLTRVGILPRRRKVLPHNSVIDEDALAPYVLLELLERGSVVSVADETAQTVGIFPYGQCMELEFEEGRRPSTNRRCLAPRLPVS